MELFVCFLLPGNKHIGEGIGLGEKGLTILIDGDGEVRMVFKEEEDRLSG